MTALNKFCLEPGREALGLRVIVAIAFAAHTLSQAVNIKQPSIFNCCVLAAAIRVNNRAVFYQPAASRLKKSVNDQLRRHSLRNLPADNPARHFVLKGR